MIKLLSLIFLILLLIVGKSRGFKTFVTFYLNLLLIMIYITFMKVGVNAIILSIIICILASLITLFILNGTNVKTKSSFISIMLVLVFMLIITIFTVRLSNIQGFSMEDIESIGYYSHDINYDMTNVIIGMYLICTIGTIIDTSISVSSAMNEIHENNPKLNRLELYKSGMNVGKDILSTTINTLFFAVVSSFIGFFMWYYSVSFPFLSVSKTVVKNVIELLLAFIASIMIIPITSYVTSIKLIKKRGE